MKVRLDIDEALTKKEENWKNLVEWHKTLSDALLILLDKQYMNWKRKHESLKFFHSWGLSNEAEHRDYNTFVVILNIFAYVMWYRW